MFGYVHQELAFSFTEHEIVLRKKNTIYLLGGGAPLEGGARWLGHPSFYGSLVPAQTVYRLWLN